jgi:5-aminolevulinate synthase
MVNAITYLVMVLTAMHKTPDQLGAGSGGIQNISGTNRQHVELETAFADLHDKAEAWIFTSGWISNLVPLGALG